MLILNVLEAGVRSAASLSFERARNVYSLGPGGSAIFLAALEVGFHSSSNPSTFVSNVNCPSMPSGSTTPENSNVTVVVLGITSFSFGPALIMVLRKNGEGGAGRMIGCGACCCFCALVASGVEISDVARLSFKSKLGSDKSRPLKMPPPEKSPTEITMIKIGIKSAIAIF